MGSDGGGPPVSGRYSATEPARQDSSEPAEPAARLTLRLAGDLLQAIRGNDTVAGSNASARLLALEQALASPYRDSLRLGVVRVLAGYTQAQAQDVAVTLNKAWNDAAQYRSEPQAPASFLVFPVSDMSEQLVIYERAIGSPSVRALALLAIAEAGAQGTGVPDAARQRWRDEALAVLKSSKLALKSSELAEPVFVDDLNESDRTELVDDLALIDLKLRWQGALPVDRRNTLTQAAVQQFNDYRTRLVSQTGQPREATAWTNYEDRTYESNLVGDALKRGRELYEQELSVFLKVLGALGTAALSGLGFVLGGLLTPVLPAVMKRRSGLADPPAKPGPEVGSPTPT